MFYLNSTLNFGIPPVLVLEVYYKVDKQTGLTAQQKGTTTYGIHIKHLYVYTQ